MKVACIKVLISLYIQFNKCSLYSYKLTSVQAVFCFTIDSLHSELGLKQIGQAWEGQRGTATGKLAGQWWGRAVVG